MRYARPGGATPAVATAIGAVLFAVTLATSAANADGPEDSTAIRIPANTTNQAITPHRNAPGERNERASERLGAKASTPGVTKRALGTSSTGIRIPANTDAQPGARPVARPSTERRASSGRSSARRTSGSSSRHGSGLDGLFGRNFGQILRKQPTQNPFKGLTRAGSNKRTDRNPFTTANRSGSTRAGNPFSRNFNFNKNSIGARNERSGNRFRSSRPLASRSGLRSRGQIGSGYNKSIRSQRTKNPFSKVNRSGSKRTKNAFTRHINRKIRR